MANQDSFIDEVTEEVRRDRLYALMRKYGWLAIFGVVVLVGGAAFVEWRRSSAEAQAQAAGDAIIAALEAGEPGARSTALAEIEVTGDSAQAALLSLMTASAEAEAGDADGAVARLDALVADNEAPQTLRNLAALKAVIVGAETLDPDDRLTRLSALTVAGQPYRLIALEQAALAEIEKGETSAALDTLRSILADASVTPDLRERATQLIVALGGSPSDE